MIGSGFLPWASDSSDKNLNQQGPKQLLALSIHKVDKSSGNLERIGEAFELKDFSIFYRHKVRNAIQALSGIIANQTIPGGIPKIINDEDIQDHDCLINFSNKSMCCILVMRKGLPANSAVFITNLIVNEILDMRESSQNKLNLEVFLRDCLWKYENYDSTNELSGLNGCLDELKVIMSSSVQQAIEKGGKLDDLVNECQQLDELTRQYVLKTKKLNACCNWW